MDKRRSALVGVIAVLALAGPESAPANTKTVGDGNDVSIALDIRSVSHGHARSRVTHTLRTYGAFSSRLLQGDNVIVFAFDTNGTARSAERFVFVFWAGRLRAAVTNRNGDFISWASVSRPSSRSVKVKLSRRSLGKPAGYRWVGLTVMGSRADRAPNRGLILHDIRAPNISFLAQPIPADLTYDVTFSVSDKGGSGLKSWRLQQRHFGATTWSTLATGGSGGAKSVSVSALEGADDDYRVLAVDGQGNRRISRIRTVSVPVDDASADVVYTGSWFVPPPDVNAFLQTLHRTLTVNDSFTYEFDGSYVSLVGPAACSTGTVTIDGGAPAQIRVLCSALPRQVLYSQSLANEHHTLLFMYTGPANGTTDSFGLDGIISR
jgi:hypothetical protein